jgi:hypothetical protein
VTGARRVLGPGALALLLAAHGACAARRGIPGAPPLAAAHSVGHYAGRLEREGQPARGFRLMLFVAAPDRIHAEVLAPLGPPELVLDGGAGRLAITLVGEGRSYVGPARPEALSRVLGPAIELTRLVDAVLRGDAGDSGLSVQRSGPPGSLPESLTLASEDMRLTLKRKRLRALERPAEELGTGRAPSGAATYPLDEFLAEER